MSFYSICHLGQVLPGVLQEMGRIAMRFERGIIFVLFIDEEAAGLGAVPMYLIDNASRLFARFFGEFRE